MTLPRIAAFALLGLSAVALLFGGTAGLALFRAAEPQVFVGPGETRLEVRQGRPRTLWVYVKPLPQTRREFPPAPAVTASARGADGAEVSLVRATTVMSVSLSASRRYAVGDFQFSSPGQYLIRIDAPAERHDFSLTDAGHARRVTQFALGTLLGLAGIVGSAVWLLVRRA